MSAVFSYYLFDHSSSGEQQTGLPAVKVAYFELLHVRGSPEQPTQGRGAVATSRTRIAESPGLLWTLEDTGDGPAILSAGGANEVVELSVWENQAALEAFVLQNDGDGPDDQADAPPASGSGNVAWWVSDRHEPTLAEAYERLEFLREHGSSPYAFLPSEPQQQLSIDRVWLDDVDVQLLIAQLNADLYSRYPEPGALIFSLDPGDIVDGVGALLLAVRDGRPVGCGAFRVIDDQPGSAEIKRLYVAMSARGNKIGAALLVELERGALELGVHRFVLEAGPRQPEALRRFERAGYVVCEPWGEFIGKDLSICMVKVRIRH